MKRNKVHTRFDLWSIIHLIKMLLPILLIVIVLLSSIPLSFNDKEYTITVTEKDRIVKSKSSYYLIWGHDENGTEYVFKNDDNFLRLKFNSSDIYGKLKVGESYKITVVGLRIQIFSMYKNIIKYEKVEE